jgi:predicted ArsR family transcriptional regulator
VRERLTKAQVEALLAHLDGPLDALLVALADAVEAVTGSRDVVAVLRQRGRIEEATALAAGGEATAWALATELNERRHL